MAKRLLLAIVAVIALLILAAPADASGYPPAEVEVVDVEAGEVPAPRDAARLPRTGDDSSVSLARVGVALVAAGGLVTVLTRRRREPAG
ncbi:MAG: LPXTG cell wall anchor domain-containing protein [Acidimicrobiia bacterium]